MGEDVRLRAVVRNIAVSGIEPRSADGRACLANINRGRQRSLCSRTGTGRVGFHGRASRGFLLASAFGVGSNPVAPIFSAASLKK